MSEPAGANARIERRWSEATTYTVLWPAAVLEPERLAAACVRVAGAAEPASFVARRIAGLARDGGTTPAEYLARHGHRFVAASASRNRGELLHELGDRELPALPFSFVVGSGGFALAHSHELGDGSVSGALLESVVGAYRDGGPGARVPGRIATGTDLVRALAALWCARPRGIPETVAGVYRRSRRPSVPPGGTAPGGTATGGTATGGTATGGTATGHARTEVVTVPAADVAALDRWRRTAGPSAPSMSVSLLWVVARVLADHGYPPGPQPWQVMVNMRVGAPALTGLGGNLIGRALVDVDPGRGPAPAADRLRRQIACGEILALHTGKVLAEVARRTRGGRVSAGRSTGLVWSDRGRHAFGAAFRAAVAPSPAVAPVAVTFMTPRRAGIGVNVGWLGDGATLVLTFGACPLSDDAVDGVVRTLETRVSGLLEVAAEQYPIAAARSSPRGRRSAARFRGC